MRLPHVRRLACLLALLGLPAATLAAGPVAQVRVTFDREAITT